MSALQAEVDQASRTLDGPDGKALSAAVALSAAMSRAEDDTARTFPKRDADIEAIRKDVSTIKLDIAGMKDEIGLLKRMTGTTIALLVTVLFRVFTH